MEIDANYFTCAVRDCFWRLHCVGEAYDYSKVDQSNSGQPACIVHVGNAADHLRQIGVCEPAVQWAIEYVILCNPPVLWPTTPIIKYSWLTGYFGMPGLGRASQI